MSRLVCCARARSPDMGVALSHPQEGEVCDSGGAVPLPTMADVIRERKKKAGGAGLGTLRRRLAAAARRPGDSALDNGCDHARFIRSVVSPWRVAEVFLLSEQLEASAALRDLTTQAELAREPARDLHADLHAYTQHRRWCDVELVGAGWSVWAHRPILAARCSYFRELLLRHPPGCARVPLDGVAATLSREDIEVIVRALCAGPHASRTACKYSRSAHNDHDLDIISNENNRCGGSCGCRGSGAGLRRLRSVLGARLDSLHRDCGVLIECGEFSDVRLVFVGECGSKPALEIPCHRAILAARSRFFRGVLSRRAGDARVCVDESVVRARFARALLHAAYTDHVDFSLIGRAGGHSPSTTTRGGSGRGPPSTRTLSARSLEDAFQLYEIARFLEMAIVVQGCEDALVEALRPETLPRVLEWSAAPHASHWVHRQAMRYLRDEFHSIMGSACGAQVPRGALMEVAASPFLQASEAQLLRALLKWADKPAAAWGGGAGGARRRREAGDASLRDSLHPLLQHVRLEHLPPNHELVNQLVRRGIISPVGGACTADAWLGRGSYRPPRCFLPYLDELKALLEDQCVPEAELSRARRERYLHRIPDTLYMVAAREVLPPGGAACPEGACVSPRTRAALARRARELAAGGGALRAARLHDSHHHHHVYKQIALRAVRELSLPDSCADILLPDLHAHHENRELNNAWEGAPQQRACEPHELWPPEHEDCCRSAEGEAARCASSGSLRSAPALHAPLESSRSNSYRGEGGARLSAAVPDVAMAPNANTHLLTTRDYYRHPLPTEWGSPGVVLQLDLGDGATHTPRPGSRAQRASAAAYGTRHQREHSQAMSCLRSRADDEELRAAIELSLIRAYSMSPGGVSRRTATLPSRHNSGPVGRSSPASVSSHHNPLGNHHLTLSRGHSSERQSPAHPMQLAPPMEQPPGVHRPLAELPQPRELRPRFDNQLVYYDHQRDCHDL